ncbi:hypothetical protein [Flavobacterium sp.]|uniref:hypothetical protein n=1 Tax=Flavobacterium sp. TaxID=239 RepID=UPI002FD8A607
MNKLYWIIVFFGSYGFCQEYKLENEVLKGKIKSIELSVSKENTAQTPIEHILFDTKGRIIQSKTFFNQRLHTFERNQYIKNQIVTDLCDYCDDLDKEFAHFSIKENQKNPYTGYATAEPRRTHKTIKTIDKKGNIIRSKTFNSEGYLIWEKRLFYDKNSNLLETETFDDEGKKEPEFLKNTFNTKGLLIESVNVMRHNNLKTIYEYDSQNRKKVEKIWQDNRVMEYHYIYKSTPDTSAVYKYSKNLEDHSLQLRTKELTYYEKGKKIICITETYNNKITFVRVFEYDLQNKLRAKKYYNDKNELRSETFLIYDKKGNWIEMNVSNLINTSYNGSEPKPVWHKNTYYRKIEYY